MIYSSLVALGISSASLYGLYSSIKEYNDISIQKEELGKNIVNFKDLKSIGPNTKTLVHTIVNTDSGLLELYKIKKRTKLNYVEIDNSKVFFIDKNGTTKKHIFSQLLIPDLGLLNYHSNLKRESYLLDNIVKEKCESDGNSISSYISVKYGLGNMLLNSTNKYLTVFYPLKNKTIYMYGSNDNTNTFTSDIIGTNKQQVIDRVFLSQSDNNINKFMTSFAGFIVAAGLIAISQK